MGEFEAAQLIKTRVNDDLAAKQKEFYLRRQLKAIQKELQASSGNRQSSMELDGTDDEDADEDNNVDYRLAAMEGTGLGAVQNEDGDVVGHNYF